MAEPKLQEQPRIDLNDALDYAESYGEGAKSRAQEMNEEGPPEAQGSWVCIVPDEGPETAGPAGLILMPDSVRRKAGRLEGYRTGRVSHIGKGRHHEWIGKPGNDPVQIWHHLDDIVSVGDRVMFSRYHSDPVWANVRLPGEAKAIRRQVVFVQVNDAWCKVEDE